MKKISIVMPVYNGEKYLRESIESILRQTYQNWELILVNDCSTDNSPAIMQEYENLDSRIRVIHNSQNQKLPKSLNIGFESAVGKYFTWTSDDNRYKSEALEQMADALENNPSIGLVYADMDYIDEAGCKTGEVSIGEENLYYNDCVGACFLYRADVAGEAGGYNAEWFLVEDYEYWLRIAERHKILHLPVNLYEYRYHGASLTETKSRQISEQLCRLRMERLDFLLGRIGEKQKEELFVDMCARDRGALPFLKQKFYGNTLLPKNIRWIEQEKKMQSDKQMILFGAGEYGKKALAYIGNERVAFFVDNNANAVGRKVGEKEIISFEKLQKIYKDYQIVISVDARKASAIANQLEAAGIKEYTTYLEMANHLKKPEENSGIVWLEAVKRAWSWISRYSVEQEGIVNNSNLRESYPEVTGYYIPTLMKWGFSDLAVSYAKWLCSIQHEDGAWYDTTDKEPYVFDTAQILKGLLAVKDRVDGADRAIRNGCDWILSNIEENGRLTTPSKGEWGEEGICSELIHLYCLSPLYEAADVYGETRYHDAAKKVADYYITEHGEEIRSFGFLSHFYAYVMEALCDIGQEKLAGESMKQMERLLDEKGYVPAYQDVKWVCSTGMFQLAIVWYKLGDLARGNKALYYAARLQNESGGWYGSYPIVDDPKATDRTEYPDYFADAEISWAVKYFLDAVYFKNQLEFEHQAHIFKDSIAEDDGRYKVILSEIQNSGAEKICDVGCGKGRYLKNLLREIPQAAYCAVDISKNVMEGIKPPVEKKAGTLTQIPYADGTFDLVYTVEALEHSIFPGNALRELLRVTKPGGEVVVIDKNQAAMGLLEIDEWEQWFENELFEQTAKENHCQLRVIENISYEDGVADGLFNAWFLQKGI